ncbi:MAG: TolC family protein [Bacteroidia bacterium]|nr:TolC family protein [Bacteroidia bacterium]
MKRILFALTITLVGFNPTLIQAQQVWSLEKCINYALDNNIKIKQGAIATEYQKNQLQQTKFSRLPSLNGQTSQNMNFGRSLTYENTYKDINSSETNFGLGVSLPVFQGFQISNNISKLELDLQASVEDLSKAKSDISVNIASTFLEILFAKDLVLVSSNQLDITRLQIKQINEKVEAGSLAKGNLLDIEAQAAGEELNLVNAKNQLQLAKLKLAQLLELSLKESFDIETPSFPEISAQASIVAANEVYNAALLTRPEIKGADLRFQSSKFQLKMAQGLQYPTVNLYANVYDTYNNKYTDRDGKSIAFSDQLKNNQRKGVGLQMNIPIFNKFQTKYQIDNARLQVLNTGLELEGAKKLLRSDVETAQTNAIAALNRFTSNQKAVSAMREAFRYSSEKFAVGLVNTIEYNTAKTKLSKSESDLLQAKYEFIFRTKILDFYRGLPLVL